VLKHSTLGWALKNTILIILAKLKLRNEIVNFISVLKEHDMKLEFHE
jgi:hypothetical protein